MNSKHFSRFLEFLLVGFLMGIVEDLIAVKAATGLPLQPSTVIIVALISLPFAVFSELIVDKEDFTFFKTNKDK